VAAGDGDCNRVHVEGNLGRRRQRRRRRRRRRR